ncbi:hypothetical protein PRIPAC_85966 [Pristionchus pacificus]|uniref:BTB domain-containing protein n=1 Tax=Pristionchus pacificus TaxID=54126 RepID=A0A2A6BS19_PRIPA|nr:hypothetical protein PRIPAC_85966 [Pristionchus pacificus]|eukprot:PDM68700.1 BTB domain-containing protein [Pristionchus pacificus]
MAPAKRKATTTVDAARKESRRSTSVASERIPHRNVLPANIRPDPEAQHKQTIMWNCDNVSTIDDNGRNSPTYTIRGMKWYIRVRTETSERTQNEQQFSVYIYCLEKNNLDTWYADVLSNVTLINRRDTTKNKKERFSYRFSHGLSNSGYASFVKMSELLAPEQARTIIIIGYILNNTIKIEVVISVVKIHGLTPPATVYDFTQPIEHLTDGILIVGGKPVHISKQILATNSPVFEALFFRGFREAKQEEIELEEVDYDEFVELLQTLYVPDKEINPTNCGYLLKMADRFQMKHSILLKLQKPSDVVSLKNQRDYVPISDTMKLIVTEHQLKLMNKKP